MRKVILGLIVSIACLPVAQAGITPEEIDQAAAAVQPQVVEWRRWFHQNPELSNREFNTSARIVEILHGMGLEPRTGIAHTGVVAIIEGGLPGPLVAIRTDIDGLPVVEQTGLPFPPLFVVNTTVRMLVLCMPVAMIITWPWCWVRQRF